MRQEERDAGGAFAQPGPERRRNHTSWDRRPRFAIAYSADPVAIAPGRVPDRLPAKRLANPDRGIPRGDGASARSNTRIGQRCARHRHCTHDWQLKMIGRAGREIGKSRVEAGLFVDCCKCGGASRAIAVAAQKRAPESTRGQVAAVVSEAYGAGWALGRAQSPRDGFGEKRHALPQPGLDGRVNVRNRLPGARFVASPQEDQARIGAPKCVRIGKYLEAERHLVRVEPLGCRGDEWNRRFARQVPVIPHEWCGIVIATLVQGFAVGKIETRNPSPQLLANPHNTGLAPA